MSVSSVISIRSKREDKFIHNKRGELLNKVKLPGINPACIPSRDEGKKRTSPTSVKSLARMAVAAILDKKGRNILVLDMSKVSGIADIFIVSTGDSDLQIRAIVESIKQRLRERAGERPWHVEGTDYFQWVLLDYVDLVVHVFHQEKRAYYALERLWGDAPQEEISDDGNPESITLLQD